MAQRPKRVVFIQVGERPHALGVVPYPYAQLVLSVLVAFGPDL